MYVEGEGQTPTSIVVAAGPPSARPPSAGPPKISIFFSPLPQFAFFLHSLGGLLVEFWCRFEGRDTRCHVWALGLSCETPAGSRTWVESTTTVQLCDTKSCSSSQVTNLQNCAGVCCEVVGCLILNLHLNPGVWNPTAAHSLIDTRQHQPFHPRQSTAPLAQNTATTNTLQEVSQHGPDVLKLCFARENHNMRKEFQLRNICQDSPTYL